MMTSTGKSKNTTLTEMFRYIEVKGAGKRSASCIETSKTAGITQYRNNKKINTVYKPNADKTKSCSYCGEKGPVEDAPGRQPKTTCPAYNHLWEFCKRTHHFSVNCAKQVTKQTVY